MRSKLVTVLTLATAGVWSASADLSDQFASYQYVWEIGVSGLASSYAADTQSGSPVSGPTTGSALPLLGPDRVSYPSGIGEQPSPGGATGANFDQGVLGVQVFGDQLFVRLASAMDPQSGFYLDSWRTWYGQGDVFITVEDENGISHYALLSAWARDEEGDPRSLNHGHFNAARNFHTGAGTGGGTREGHLIALTGDNDITLAGGRGAYNSRNAPDGLDLRVFARGGTDLGDANLVHSSVEDFGRTWYIQTWTLDLDDLSDDATFDIALHAAASCGNDQIGGTFSVPEPASLVPVLAGLVLLARRRWFG